MIFRELVFKDFLSFRGKNVIQFPDPSKHETCLVLVLAANNSGKTNTIRALRFLLYGDLLGFPKSPQRLINDVARNTAKKGLTVEGWVQATIELGEGTLTFRRRISTRKVTPEKTSVPEVTLEHLVDERNKKSWLEDGGTTERTLAHLAPLALFDYFYFQGEELASQMASRSPRIREGLDLLLHQRKWGDAQSTLEAVRTEFSKELRKLGETNREYTRAHDDYELSRTHRQKLAAQLEEVQERNKKAEQEFSETARALSKLTAGLEVASATNSLNSAHETLRDLDRRIQEAYVGICQGIGRSCGLPFLQAAFKPALRILHEMRESNLLPADVTSGLVERLLAGDTPACICGRTLRYPEDDHSRQCLVEFAERSLSADVNHSLLSLVNALEPGISTGFVVRAQETSRDLANLVKEYNSLSTQVVEVKSQVGHYTEQLEAVPSKDISQLQQRANQLADVRTKSSGESGQLKAQIDMLDRRLPTLKNQVDRLRRSGGHERMTRLVQLEETAERLGELIDSSQRQLRRDFHRLLQSSVAQYYDKVATDGSKARVDPTTLLPSVLIGGEPQHNIGGGQMQLLVLSHILSLAHLRNQLHESLDELGIKVGRLDDQSFFLDSVFAPADDLYAGQVAAFLPGKARQIVLLLASQQWHKAVADAIEPHVDRAYKFLLRSPNPQNNTVVLYEHTVDLIAAAPEGTGAHTVIEEIV